MLHVYLDLILHFLRPKKIVPPLSATKGDDELSWRDMAESDSAGVQKMVHGFSVPVQRRTSAEAKQKMNPYKPPSSSTKTSKSGTPGRIGKIRNYNVKDWHTHVLCMCQYTVLFMVSPIQSKIFFSE